MARDGRLNVNANAPWPNAAETAEHMNQGSTLAARPARARQG
jgi:hypothetical protein